MKIESAGRTHVGRRPNNEDAFCVEPAWGLYAVADGMGGYEGGEVASRLVVETLQGFFRRNAADGDATWPFAVDPKLGYLENIVATGVRLADREVQAQRKGRLGSMGSTLALLAVRDARAVVAHVGDSRVYRLRDGALRQLTRDHSLWTEMRATGTAGVPDRREDHPFGNVITRALGMKNAAKPDLFADDLRPGDTFLLCSDGLSEPVPDDVIARALATRAPDEACASLVWEAFERGGRDNITAVVARVAG